MKKISFKVCSFVCIWLVGWICFTLQRNSFQQYSIDLLYVVRLFFVVPLEQNMMLPIKSCLVAVDLGYWFVLLLKMDSGVCFTRCGQCCPCLSSICGDQHKFVLTGSLIGFAIGWSLQYVYVGCVDRSCRLSVLAIWTNHIA